VTLGESVAQGAWISYWRFWQRYHRYTVDGLEHLDGPFAKLIVGYHARGTAMDMCMLTVALFDRYGYLPHGFVHRSVENFPPVRWFTHSLGFLVRDGPELEAAVRKGEHLVTTPGGGREGLRGVWDRYRVSWGEDLGYVRLAVKYRLPIVPVGCAGADDLFIGLNDVAAIGRALNIPMKRSVAFWLGLGPLGVYPFSPPFPVRLSQLVGQPIDPFVDGDVRLDDEEALRRIHRRVTRAVQRTLDDARRTKRRNGLWR
jgi:1-acyl-sn-glycerol-3-phosphate acyltransferase